MREFLIKMGFPIKPAIIIDSRETLEKAAESFGILPFFPNTIKGLSVEEMCAPGMLFGGNYDEGCWEWKGPVIRKRTSAYGKIFKRKAGFVSLDLLPYFINYRRTAYPFRSGGTEEMLLEIIRENDSLSSTELKKLIFSQYEREVWYDLPGISIIKNTDNKKGRKSLEGPLQRLQMGGWILISDFEYKTTKRGERYGWGVARYSTPEVIFGDYLKEYDLKDPNKSFEFMVKEMRKKWPAASSKAIENLLK